MKRRLIEYDLPLAEISEASAREKSIRHGHPSTLHIWWARRPLAASRATAFAALIDDPGPEEPEKRAELLELIKKITPWEAVKDGNSPDIERARELIEEQYGYAPKVLDPFAGGGSIPLEALRLGCETYASDYNPVAVFIEKATLEWPQKFGIMADETFLEQFNSGDGRTQNSGQSSQKRLLGRAGRVKVNLLAYLVEQWANIILEEVQAEIGHFYPPDTDGWIPVGYVWSRTIPCQNPTCSSRIPLIKSFWLAQKKNKNVAYRPVVDFETESIAFQVLEGDQAIEDAQFDPSQGTVSRGNAHCLVCGQVTKAADTKRIAQDGQIDDRLLLVISHSPNESGKRYSLAAPKDESLFEQAAAYLQEKLENWPYLETPLPDEAMAHNSRYLTPPGYGMFEWKDLFNARQQLALISFLQSIRSASGRMVSEISPLVEALNHDNESAQVDVEELSQAITSYLAIMLDRLVDFGSTLCVLNSTGGRGVRNTFGRNAIPMTWDFMETNFFNPAGASWQASTERTVKTIIRLSLVSEQPAISLRQNAAALPFSDDMFDCLVTDPPYYDNVPYAALSDYFYVWLKRAVGALHPDLFVTPLVPKRDEAVMEPTRHPSAEQARQFYERQLATSFREMERVLKPGGVSIIVYAHKTTEGWETMLHALLDAGLVITGSWPLHTEKKGRLREIASAALASSIYMVCRKLDREVLGFWNELQPRIKARVEEKLAQFWGEGIAGGDFFISAIGPGMEEYSRF